MRRWGYRFDLVGFGLIQFDSAEQVWDGKGNRTGRTGRTDRTDRTRNWWVDGWVD